MSETSPIEAPKPEGSNLKTYVLFGAVIALAVASVMSFVQIDKVRTEMAQANQALLQEITTLRQASTTTSAANRQHLDQLRDELETARRQAAVASGVARKAAEKHAEELAARLAAEQQKQAQQVNTQLAEVKEATSTANTKIADVSTDVSNVKTEVASTKSELDKTIADLKRVTGDLGVQSGLIATNAKELAALRALGERNYFEFTLNRTKQFQRIGDVAVQLKKSDVKRNRYTIELIADDKKVEKKDKGVNEPVQFYTSKARLPYEIVVNSVKKDQIVGYLSTPKVMEVARN